MGYQNANRMPISEQRGEHGAEDAFGTRAGVRQHTEAIRQRRPRRTRRYQLRVSQSAPDLALRGNVM
jgi:hypothetical protein